MLWSPIYAAWTLPGRYVYITRELQQTLQSDDAVAFVLAHEMAHHDLGHVRAAAAEPGDEGRSILRRLASTPSLATVATYLRTRWMRPELELEADQKALALCEAAGYTREDCLQAFDAMRKRLLDLGDVEGVYALDAHPDDDPDWAWLRERLRQRIVGYPSIWERKQRLLDGIAPGDTEAPAAAEPEAEAEPGRRRIPDPPEYL